MASVFAITTATDKIKAETGSATAVFTVTNSTARPLRCLVKARPLGNTQAEWLKIEGETERDFPAGGTHQYTVDFNQPKPPAPPAQTQAAESFPFRLDAISAANPDEDFTEGPVVTVEIPERKIEEKKPFQWWWAIAVGAVVLLIVGGAVAWLLTRPGDDKVEVPDVVNRTFADAANTLRNANLAAVRIDASAANREPDRVFAQEPAAGAKVNANTNVNVSLPATITVPRVVGLDYATAQRELAGRDLLISGVIGSRDLPASADPSLVAFQFPTPGMTALKGSEVKVFFPCSPRTRGCFRLEESIGDRIRTIDPGVLENVRRFGRMP